MSPYPPTPAKTVAFFEGQNLYGSAKDLFNYIYPNYDPPKLAQHICNEKGWQLVNTRFYTGVPIQSVDPFCYHFWTAKFANMGRQKVYLFRRYLRYNHDDLIAFANGQTQDIPKGREKGIDVRIAIDVIRLAHQRAYDVALIFSQDQDLSEVANEIRTIAREQNRWIKIASAFRWVPHLNIRGINNTDWIRIDKPTYDLCIDPQDYRPRRP